MAQRGPRRANRLSQELEEGDREIGSNHLDIVASGYESIRVVLQHLVQLARLVASDKIRLYWDAMRLTRGTFNGRQSRFENNKQQICLVTTFGFKIYNCKMNNKLIFVARKAGRKFILGALCGVGAEWGFMGSTLQAVSYIRLQSGTRI